jgi:hypothetical protein
MTHTVTFTTDIPPTRELLVRFPESVPIESAEISIRVCPRQEGMRHILGDFQASEYCGMWKDREDIEDSVEFAHDLRLNAWRRSLP